MRILSRALSTTSAAKGVIVSELAPASARVATATQAGRDTATVGVWLKVGSRNEGPGQSGSSQVLASAFGDAAEAKLGPLGVQVGAYSGRESTSLYATCAKEDASECFKVLADCVQHPQLDGYDVDGVVDDGESGYSFDLLDHLHAISFQGTPLAATGNAAEELTKQTVQAFHASLVTPSNMYLVGAGCIEHDDMKSIAMDAIDASKQGEASTSAPAPFTPAAIQVEEPDMGIAHVALALDTSMFMNHPAWLLLEHMIGNWTKFETPGRPQDSGSRLIDYVGGKGYAHSLSSFAMNYSDAGLWGVMADAPTDQLDDLVHGILQEWVRLAFDIKDVEVNRALSILRTDLALKNDTTALLADDVADQLITSGRYISPSEVVQAAAALTPKDLTRFAHEAIYDMDFSCAVVGDVRGMPDYGRMRGWINTWRV